MGYLAPLFDKSSNLQASPRLIVSELVFFRHQAAARNRKRRRMMTMKRV